MRPEDDSKVNVDRIEFETPENIVVSYTLAGPGSRFAAWVEDFLILVVLGLLFFLLGIFFATDPNVSPVMLGVLIFLLGVAPILYFAVFEYFWNGQTQGKRTNHIRVVTLDGFRLTVSAVLIRNIFRVIDTIPLLWIVPLVTRRSQRFGDIVAGTVVVYDEAPRSVESQAALLKNRQNRRFTFSAAQVVALGTEDLDKVGIFLERRSGLPQEQADRLTARMATALALRLGSEPPASDDGLLFLKNLYATHLENQLRELD